MTTRSSLEHLGGTLRFMQKLFALVLGVWLFMVPMVMFSAEVIAFCDEYGTSTIPLMEEEEVKHQGTNDTGRMVLDRSRVFEEGMELPQWEEFPHCSLYGEVPLRPPRKA